MSHFKEICEHGYVLTQCRCPAPDKKIIVGPCPSDPCPGAETAEEVEERAEELFQEALALPQPDGTHQIRVTYPDPDYISPETRIANALERIADALEGQVVSGPIHCGSCGYVSTGRFVTKEADWATLKEEGWTFSAKGVLCPRCASTEPSWRNR